MKHFFLCLICAAIAVMLAACGGTSSTSGFPGPGTENGQTDYRLVSSDGFKLRIYDSSFQYGGSASFQLIVQQSQHGRSVSVETDSNDLRSLHLQLDYDNALLHPVETSLLDWPGFGGDSQLNLAVSDIPGSVHLGSTIVQPDRTPGASGSFIVATVLFDDGPVSGGRTASAAPSLPASRIPDLMVDEGSGDISFSYNSVGDYDQNSVVNISDITPLGINFNEAPAGGNTYPFDSSLSVVDGDSNGLITIADITPIGVNFGNSIESWTLYGGSSADYPVDAGSDNGTAVSLGSVGFADDTGLNTAEFRLKYEANLPDVSTSSAESFWLRPVSGGSEGISSNLAGAGAADTEPPFWLGGAPEDAGVMSVIPGDGSVRVNWYEADDLLSWPGVYTVYWNEGDTVDFGTASTMDLAGLPKDDENSSSEQTFVVEGLSNETQYAFAVRVRDGADPANAEDNTGMLSTTPHASQELPAAIDADLLIEGPATLGLGNTVEFSNDAILTINGDLTIDGTLHGGDTDICIIVKGNLIIKGQIVQELTDLPVIETDDAKSVKIVAEGDAEFNDAAIDANGNIQIVSSEDDLLSPTDATDEIDNGAFDEFPFTFMPLEGAQASTVSSSNRSASNHIVYYGPGWTWHMKGNWGTIPVQPKGVKRVILRVYQRRGTVMGTNWNITGPSGRDGQAVTKCDTAVGENGEDNRWRMRMHASRRIVLDNCTITMGSGGAGGAGEALGCCPLATATGGKGGKSNNKYRITAGNLIQIKNTFTMNPGWGGNGGDADASGGDGADGCPPDDGCDAIATGGKGGDMPLWGMAVRGNVLGGASIVLGKAFGGDGGWATATGGLGGNDTCCGKAGDGGSASASAGDGGMAKYITGSGFTGMGGGAESGTGGDARADGGAGGDGAPCFKAKAGDGGDGGDAVAFGGLAGPVESQAVAGQDGDADATGGDGGNGGDGFPVGAGGIGGIASALGANTTEVDGNDGNPGTEWPTGGLWIWCIDIPSLVPVFPGPLDPPIRLPDGFTTSVTLIDMETMLPIGTVPFTVHDSTINPGSGVYIYTNNEVPSNPHPEIQINNNEDPEDSIQIDIELTQLNLSGTNPVCIVGAKFDVGQCGSFIPAEISAQVDFFVPDPFLPLGGGAIPPVPYVPGVSVPVEIIPDPSLPDGDPTFDMSITVSPLSFLNLWTIYIIDP